MVNWFERNLAGSIHVRLLRWHFILYGFNAMHVAINVYVPRFGWICFHPTMYCFGRWWPWKFYISRNATPSIATFVAGPTFTAQDKHRACLRRNLLGFRFRVSDYKYEDLINIDRIVATEGW